MVADGWVFVGVGRFYLQSNTARIVPITLTKNRITYFSGLTILADLGKQIKKAGTL